MNKHIKLSGCVRRLTDTDLAHRWLHLAMNIGKYMIKSGAEISRVEHTLVSLLTVLNVRK